MRLDKKLSQLMDCLLPIMDIPLDNELHLQKVHHIDILGHL